MATTTGRHPTVRFDVFLSYNWQDHGRVEEIAKGLAECGVKVFLDRWYLTPGRPWPEVLEETLATCKSVVVFLGPHGMGPWQQREKYLALERQGHEPGFQVIPVLLPGSDPALGFLNANTWIDLSAVQDRAEAIRNLAKAIGGETLGYPPPPAARICPYRGLQSFREEDEPFFFGREDYTDQLQKAVERQRFIAIVGASGSGKSSVVQAGLLPRLRRRADGTVWEIMRIVPGNRPLDALAASLHLHLEPGMGQVDRLIEVRKLADHLRDPTVLKDAVEAALRNQAGTDRFLLIVDQWEELYTLCTEDADRQTFIDALLDATEHGSLTLLLTLRGDFYGEMLEHRELADRLRAGLVNLAPMNRAELEQAMVGPARAVGLEFEDGLVNHILEDVEKAPGSLPLLAFVLAQLWEGRRGMQLTHNAYTAMGEVEGAIAHRAEALYGELSDPEQELLRQVFMQLVRPGEGTEDTRRRATIAELSATALPLVRKLADARLLVTGRDEVSGEETVEVTHEALIHHWDRLRGWIEDDRRFLRWRHHFRESLRQWKEANRDSGALLRGAPLEEAKRWLAVKAEELGEEELGYVLESKRADRRRRWRRPLGAIAAVALIASLILVFAFRQRAREQERRSWAIGVLTTADNLENSLTGALLMAELAGSPEPPGGVNVARRLVDSRFPAAVLNGHSGRIFSASFSPDGAYVLTASADGTARIWQADGRGMPLVLLGHAGPILSAAFSPDGSLVATASEDGTARVWRLEEPDRSLVVQADTFPIYSVAFSQDGSKLATASEDGTARIWRSGTADQLSVLRGHQGPVYSAEFDPGGNRVVTASQDGTARIWTLDGEGEALILRGHAGGVLEAKFDRRGVYVATASYDGTARVWRVDGTYETQVVARHSGTVWSSSFNRSTSQIVTASDDGVVRVWPLDAPEPIELGQHAGRIWTAIFSPDGQLVATASDDSTARIWRSDGSGDPIVLRDGGGSVSGAAFGPDGSAILAWSEDGSARVWSVNGSGDPLVLRGHSGGVLAGEFDPEGSRIATGGEDGEIRLWDIDGEVTSHVLTGHSQAVSDLAFSSEAPLLVSVSEDGSARAWRLTDNGGSIELGRHAGSVRSLSVSPDGAWVLTASDDKTAGLWPVSGKGDGRVLRGHGDAVRNAEFDARGSRALTASLDSTIRIWHLAKSDTSVTTMMLGSPVVQAVFNKQGSRIATALADGGVRVLRADGAGAPLQLLGHEAAVKSVEFSPNGSQVLTASDDATARLWRMDRVGEPVVLRGHKASVLMASFSADGQRVVTASGDHTARVWRVDGRGEPLILEGHRAAVRGANFSPGGSRVLTVSDDGTARLWRTDWSGLVNHLRASTTACLTVDQRQTLLGESHGEARAAHHRCEQRFGRMPESGV